MPKQNISSIITEFIPDGIKKRIPRKRYLIIGVIVLVVLYLLFWPKGNNQEQIQYTQVKRQDIASTVSASGILDGKHDISLHFNSAGKLAYINFKQGDKIDKGAQVAGLDVQALNIALQQAQNSLRTAQENVTKTLDDIHLNQYGNGGLGQIGSSQETETQKLARTTAEATRDSATDSVKAAQRAFQDSVLYAPMSGLVVQANPVSGQNISASDTILQIADDSEIVFASDVDESDLSKIALNQPVNVSLNAYPDQKFNGSVVEISPITKTTSSGATVVTVKIALQNPPANFVVGLNGQAEIKTHEAKNALTIPQDALRDDNTVLVQNGSSFKAVPVQIGIKSDTDIEVTQGLMEGQTVVKNPTAVKTPQPLPIQKGS